MMLLGHHSVQLKFPAPLKKVLGNRVGTLDEFNGTIHFQILTPQFALNMSSQEVKSHARKDWTYRTSIFVSELNHSRRWQMANDSIIIERVADRADCRSLRWDASIMMRVIANVVEKSSHYAAVGKYCASCDCSLHLKRMRTIG
mmetsp:Transcript_31031/g.53052  ORF Transcript_31031/g.53052 Transcript_31031/m.53052 type:complete len:144 (+) Transcript_31031:752-1183(+)